MIIHHNARPIKKVPRKYIRIPNITDHLEDENCIRLTEVERESLDQELFRLEAENFLMYLSLTDPVVFAKIKDARPLLAGKIKDPDGDVCTVLKMSNNITVRCDDSLYAISPEKFRPINEKSTQLKCFE